VKADTASTSADDSPQTAAAAPVPPPAVRTVKGYSVPGEGPSTLISVVTVVGLFALWWVATHFGWIRDLFLPTPEKVLASFG
jgi:taurine transport system permease protein